MFKPKLDRVHFFDELRGFIVILMVIYHAFYDLAAIYGTDIPFFNLPILQWVHMFVACIFMLISGVMCAFSRSNIKRGLICSLIALIITVVTHFFAPQFAIYFGVLHFLGISMIIFGLLENALILVNPLTGICFSLGLLLFTEPISQGFLGFWNLRLVKIPEAFYSGNLLAPIGIFSKSFFSADYYPLLPWFFVFLMGAYLGLYFTSGNADNWFYKKRSAGLAAVGQKALAIYVLHQPLLFILFYPLQLFVNR